MAKTSEIKNLLSAPTAQIEGPKDLPAGQYKAVVVAAEILPFHWSKSGRYGKSYVPTIQLLEPILTGDAETDAEWQQKLDAFGDWRSKKFNWTIPESKEKNRPRSASISAINFTLLKCDAEFNDLAFDDQLFRFYISAEQSKTGEEGGFCVDVLCLFGKGKSIEDLIAETEGKELIVDLQYDQPEPPYQPRLQCVGAIAA